MHTVYVCNKSPHTCTRADNNGESRQCGSRSMRLLCGQYRGKFLVEIIRGTIVGVKNEDYFLVAVGLHICWIHCIRKIIRVVVRI